MKIYVGNLPYNTTEEEIKDLFTKFGQVEGAKVVTDRDTGRARGFGFVEMSDDAQAKQAIEALHSSQLGGRTLVVNEARPREGGEGGGGRRGGGGGRPRGGRGYDD